MRSALSLTLLFALFLGSMESRASKVVIGNKEWRQLTDTVGLSWDQIHEGDDPSTPGAEGGVCPLGGQCAGSVSDVDFSGWTWATIDDVAELFAHYYGDVPAGPFNVVSLDEGAAASSFFQDFSITAELKFTADVWVWGWAATHSSYLLGAYAPYAHRYNDRSNFATDVEHNPTEGVLGRGAWLYRPAPIPLPPSLLIIGTALACTMPFLRRRTITSLN